MQNVRGEGKQGATRLRVVDQSEERWAQGDEDPMAAEGEADGLLPTRQRGGLGGPGLTLARAEGGAGPGGVTVQQEK